MLLKPDWIPLRIQRVMGSSIWHLPDYQFGWFWRGVINLADSATPGYVDEGSVELWEFFGAKSKQYFHTWGGNEFAGRYFPKTEDGTRRYNAPLLDILNKQGERKKYTNGNSENSFSPSLSIIEFDLLDKEIEKLFEKYKLMFERNSNYSLTEMRRKKCALRLWEWMKAHKAELPQAIETAELAMKNLRESDFHWQNGYYDWLDHIFKTQETFEKRLLEKKANNVEYVNKAAAKLEQVFRD